MPILRSLKGVVVDRSTTAPNCYFWRFTMDEDTKIFWEDLDIPVRDFIEDVKQNGERFRLKVFRRLKQEKALDFVSTFSQSELSTDEECYAMLQSLNDDEVLRIYCSLEFANKVHLPILRKISVRQRINPQLHKSILVDKLRLLNPQLLVEAYIHFLIERRHFKLYTTPNPIFTLIPMPSKTIIARWLTSFEHNKRNVKREREVHVWWEMEMDGWWLYLFRIGQKRSKPVRKVDKNLYEKVAGTKILLIKPDLTTVKVYTGGEEKTMKRRFTYVLQKISSNPNLEYSKFWLIFSRDVVTSFVGMIRRGEYQNLRLCSIKYNTSRFRGSPALEFLETASDGLEKTLAELEQMNKLPEDRACISLTLGRNLDEFDLTFRGTENRVEIIIGRRGLMPSTRDEILSDLNAKLLAIQNETRT